MLVLCLLCIAHCSSCVAHVCCVNTQIHSGSTHLHCLNCISSLFVVCFLMFATICSLLMCCSCLLYVAHCSCVIHVCYIHCSLLIMCFSSCVAHVYCLLLTACYSTAQPQGNKGSRVTCKSLTSCTGVIREPLTSCTRVVSKSLAVNYIIISLYSCKSTNCFIVINLLHLPLFR